MFFKPNKIIPLVLCFLLIFEQSGFAQVTSQLGLSVYISGIKSTLTQDKYRPLHLRYLGYDPNTNNFNLLLDKGDFVGAQYAVPVTIDQETNKLMEYFFIGLVLPNEAFWVNLRPDSPDNVIDTALAQTDIGKILLEADVQLKKDTALYTSPQTTEGKKYWDKLYKKAEELYGYDNITIPTLTRPWIVPGEIIIRETKEEACLPDRQGRGTIPSAYIYKATLKVMLEEDYLKIGQSVSLRGAVATKQSYNKIASPSARNDTLDPRAKELNTYSTQLIKELIIPKLTKDINTTKRYAALRQVYYSLILAQWFKNNVSLRGALATKQSQARIASSSVRNDTTYIPFINSSNLTGLTSKIPWTKDTYYQQYQKSFKDGEYNLKEPARTPFGQTIRSYFSGGVGFGQEITAAVSSGIIQGRADINPEQIFSQSAVSSGVNNNIAAVFKDGDLTVEVPDVVAKEADISDNTIVSNKRSFLIKKTLPFFLTAIVSLNSFLISCAQVRPRQPSPIYQTHEYIGNTVHEKELLITEIHSLASGNLENNKNEINKKIIQLLRIDVYEGLRVSVNIIDYIGELFTSKYCKWRSDCSRAISREIHNNKDVCKQLLEIINLKKIDESDATHKLLVALSNLYLPPKVIDALALKLDYTDGIQEDKDEDILLSILLMNYRSSFIKRLLKTKTQSIIDAALKQISWKVLSNLQNIFSLTQEEVDIIKVKISNQLQYYGYNESEVYARSGFKIYRYIQPGFSYLSGIEGLIAHETAHSILCNKGIKDYVTSDQKIMHEFFAYFCQAMQNENFPEYFFLQEDRGDPVNIPIYQVKFTQVYIKDKNVMWKKLARVALDEICKGKSFKEIVEAMFRKAGYKGVLKAVRIKGLKRDIYVPADFEIKLSDGAMFNAARENTLSNTVRDSVPPQNWKVGDTKNSPSTENGARRVSSSMTAVGIIEPLAVFPELTDLELIEDIRIEPGYIVVSNKYPELGVGRVANIEFDNGKFKIAIIFKTERKEFVLNSIKAFFETEEFKAYKEKLVTQENVYENILKEILDGPEVTFNSKQRREALVKIGPSVEKYIQRLLNNDDIKIAIIPLGSTLKGYASKNSDIEYMICILSGYPDDVPWLNIEERELISNKVQVLLQQQSTRFQAEKQLESNPEMILNLSSESQGYLHDLHNSVISYIFLPAVYGDKKLIDQIRRNVLFAVMGIEDEYHPEDWKNIQEKYFEQLGIEGQNILDKLHLYEWLSNQGVDVDFIIRDIQSKMNLSSVKLMAKQIRSLSPALEEFNKKREEKIGLPGLGEMLAIYNNKKGNVISSGVQSGPEIIKNTKGGIDFTVLPAVTQQRINPQNNLKMIPNEIASSSFTGFPRNDILDEKVFSAEWAQIERLVSSGIVPSTERIKNCLMGFCRDGSFGRCINKIICCLASVLRLEEERVNSDNSSLRMILTLIESGQPANQLQSALSKF